MWRGTIGGKVLGAVVWLGAGCPAPGRLDTAEPSGVPSPPADAASDAPRFVPPPTERGAVVDTLHGTEIADPYRWLEDTNAEATAAWVKTQNAATFAHLESLPLRKAIGERLRAQWSYERFGVPSRHGSRYVMSYNPGLADQPVLHVLDDLSAPPRVLLDPNELDAAGTTSLAGTAFSPDGELMAWGQSEAGSDWQVWHVREVGTGKDRPDELRWIKWGAVTFDGDGKGLYYARYDEPPAGRSLDQVNENQKLYWHRLGTPQAQDVLVYERPDQPKWGFSPEVTDDGRWLVVNVKVGTDPKNDLLVADLRKKPKRAGKPELEPLRTGFAAGWEVVGNIDDELLLRTDLDAPRGRVVAVRALAGPQAAARPVIPEGSDTLQSIAFVDDAFVASWLHDAHARLTVHRRDGALLHEVALPGLGSIGGLTGRRTHHETFLSFEGFAAPTEIWRLEPQSGRVTPVKKPKFAADTSAYETTQVFYPSKDGTKIPMFLVRRKAVGKDGKRPVWLYGYGGFGISLVPRFSVAYLAWMDLGGVVAIPNLRGGGEYGEVWHQAGTKAHKQNVFDDFIAAAEWLVKEGWTTPQRLVINGRSNGGLLVGAAMTQRPDLFAVALPGVGVMDMLRFHLFTIGWGWISDYGSPDDPELFATLRAYSPYHNLEPGTRYPATLVHTGDHDDRVVPGHSFKFTAALQHAHEGAPPVLIRIETRAGHGAGKPTSMQIEEWTDLLAFAAHHVGIQRSPW
jgi:prolyl oligopeptidase